MNVFNTDANTLEEYNGANPQTFNLYGTRTDAANYERMRLSFDSSDGYFFLGPDAAGTGTQRGMGFWLQGSLRWVIDPAFNFKPWSDNLKDVGSSGLRVRNLYLGTGLVFNSGTLSGVHGTTGTAAEAGTLGTTVGAGLCNDGNGNVTDQGCTTGTVGSVFGRTGVVTAQAGDYTVSQVTGAAPLASPVFIGNPAAPTPATGDNSTKIATTAWIGNDFSTLSTLTVSGSDRCAAWKSLSTHSEGGNQYSTIDARRETQNESGMALTCSSNPLPVTSGYGGSDNGVGDIYLLPPGVIATTAPWQQASNQTKVRGMSPGTNSGSYGAPTIIQAQSGITANLGTGTTYNPALYAFGVTAGLVANGMGPYNATCGDFSLDANGLPIIGLSMYSGQENTECDHISISNSPVVAVDWGGAASSTADGSILEKFNITHPSSSSCAANTTTASISGWSCTSGGVCVATYSNIPTTTPVPGHEAYLNGLATGGNGVNVNGYHNVCAVSTGSSANSGNWNDVRCKNISSLFSSANQFAFLIMTSVADSSSTAAGAAAFNTIGMRYNAGAGSGGREIDNGTIAATSCTSQQLAGLIASGKSATVFRNIHIEGVKYGAVVGWDAATGNMEFDNLPIESNVSDTAFVISNQWGEPVNITIRHLASTTATTNLLVDQGNGNTFTTANNPAVDFYMLDYAGTPWTNANCAEMTNGWCVYNGTFAYYSGGQAKFSASASGATSVTPTTGDNSTKVATTAYVQNMTNSLLWFTQPFSNGNGITLSSTANKAYLYGVVLAYPLTTTQVTYYVVGQDNTSNTYDIGIYQGTSGSTDNLMAHIGPTPGTSFAPSTGWKTLSWTAPVTLQPGRYYLAITSSCTTSCAQIGSGSTSTGFTFDYNNALGVASGGTLPASISGPADNYTVASIPVWAVH